MHKIIIFAILNIFILRIQLCFMSTRIVSIKKKLIFEINI